MDQIWELWFPQAGSAGLCFARARVVGDAAAGEVLVHAAPPQLDVVVRGVDGPVLAESSGLDRAGPEPFSVLVVDLAASRITRQDRWPTEADLGRLVILPGGEAGVLRSWWNAAGHSAWRWQVEFSNHR